MSDTFTSNLSMVKPQIGGSVDSWGNKWNTNLDTLDTIFNATGTAVNMRFASANFDDNAKALFGTGDDLEIFHDGSNSIISDVGTGGLKLMTGALFVRNPSDQDMIQAQSGGAVTLYHANSSKLVTTSSGVSVTGDITVTGNVDGVDVSGLSTTVSNLSSSLSTVATSGSYNDLSNKPTIPTNNNQLSNGAGYTTYSSNQALNTSNSPTFETMVLNGSLYVNNNDGSSDIYMQDTDEGQRRIHCNSNRIGFLNQSNGWGSYCDDSGNWFSAGNITAYSDARLKENVATIENALDKVCSMRGVSFTKDGKPSSGVIAQELEKIAPELVIEGEYKSVAYGNIVGYLIESIKELKDELKELRGV